MTKFLHEISTSMGSSGSSGQSSMTSSPISRPVFRGLPKSPRPSFLHSRLSSKDIGGLPTKARLVEQFYKSEPAPPQRAHGDSPAIFRNTTYTSLPGLSQAISIEEPLSEAIQNGHLAYRPLDIEVADLHDVAEALICIDQTISAETLQIKNIEQVIEVVSRAATEVERGLARRKLDLSGSSVQQLAHLSNYLKELQDSVTKVQKELASTTLQLEEHYREEISNSMNMLETLDSTLYVLNARLERAKACIATSKAMLGATMGEKIEALEYISAKFAEYDQLNRHRRVQQLIVALVVVVMMICGYMIVGHLRDVEIGR